MKSGAIVGLKRIMRVYPPSGPKSRRRLYVRCTRCGREGHVRSDNLRGGGCRCGNGRRRS